MDAIDIIIPTLKRPDHLRRCLEALKEQDIAPTDIWVGVRADDDLSRELLREYKTLLPVHAVEARGVGVVGSMNSCLEKCHHKWIALLDDDVEIPAHWLSSMLAHLRERNDVVAAGGRDLLMDHPGMRRAEPLMVDVGRIHWFGRVTGNHHRGGGQARAVDILRGSNCLFDGNFLRRTGFERGLRGQGAQVNWELALALQAMQHRCHMRFDPAVGVVHNVAPRHDDDSVHRGVFHSAGTLDIAFNETYVVLKHGRGARRLAMLMWQLVIGSDTCPGLMRSTDFLRRPKSRSRERFAATWSGRWLACRQVLFEGRQATAEYTAVAASPVRLES